MSLITITRSTIVRLLTILAVVFSPAVARAEFIGTSQSPMVTARWALMESQARASGVLHAPAQSAAAPHLQGV